MVAGGARAELTATPIVAASTGPAQPARGARRDRRGRGPAAAFFRVPWRAAYLPLRAAELVRLPSPMRSDSALSIATLDPDPFAWGAPPRDASFRPFEMAALRPAAEPATS